MGNTKDTLKIASLLAAMDPELIHAARMLVPDYYNPPPDKPQTEEEKALVVGKAADKRKMREEKRKRLLEKNPKLGK